MYPRVRKGMARRAGVPPPNPPPADQSSSEAEPSPSSEEQSSTSGGSDSEDDSDQDDDSNQDIHSSDDSNEPQSAPRYHIPNRPYQPQIAKGRPRKPPPMPRTPSPHSSSTQASGGSRKRPSSDDSDESSEDRPFQRRRVGTVNPFRRFSDDDPDDDDDGDDDDPDSEPISLGSDPPNQDPEVAASDLSDESSDSDEEVDGQPRPARWYWAKSFAEHKPTWGVEIEFVVVGLKGDRDSVPLPPDPDMRAEPDANGTYPDLNRSFIDRRRPLLEDDEFDSSDDDEDLARQPNQFGYTLEPVVPENAVPAHPDPGCLPIHPRVCNDLTWHRAPHMVKAMVDRRLQQELGNNAPRTVLHQACRKRGAGPDPNIQGLMDERHQDIDPRWQTWTWMKEIEGGFAHPDYNRASTLELISPVMFGKPSNEDPDHASVRHICRALRSELRLQIGYITDFHVHVGIGNGGPPISELLIRKVFYLWHRAGSRIAEFVDRRMRPDDWYRSARPPNTPYGYSMGFHQHPKVNSYARRRLRDKASLKCDVYGWDRFEYKDLIPPKQRTLGWDDEGWYFFTASMRQLFRCFQNDYPRQRSTKEYRITRATHVNQIRHVKNTTWGTPSEEAFLLGGGTGHAAVQRKTFEFRISQGSLDPDIIMLWTRFLVQMVMFCHAAPAEEYRDACERFMLDAYEEGPVFTAIDFMREHLHLAPGDRRKWRDVMYDRWLNRLEPGHVSIVNCHGNCCNTSDVVHCHGGGLLQPLR